MATNVAAAQAESPALWKEPVVKEVTGTGKLDLAPLAVWTRGLDAVALPEAQDAAAFAERLGFAAIWFGETTGLEAFLQSALLLQATHRITVGTGIINV